MNYVFISRKPSYVLNKFLKTIKKTLDFYLIKTNNKNIRNKI